MTNTNNTASCNQMLSTAFPHPLQNYTLRHLPPKKKNENEKWLKTAQAKKNKTEKTVFFTYQHKVAPRLKPPAMLCNAIGELFLLDIAVISRWSPLEITAGCVFSNGEAPSPPVIPCSSAAVSHAYHVNCSLLIVCYFFTSTYQLHKCIVMQTLRELRSESTLWATSWTRLLTMTTVVQLEKQWRSLLRWTAAGAHFAIRQLCLFVCLFVCSNPITTIFEFTFSFMLQFYS